MKGKNLKEFITDSKKRAMKFEEKFQKIADDIPDGCGILIMSPDLEPSYYFNKANRRMILGTMERVKENLIKDDIMKAIEENLEKITDN
jgi:hypothetical protein